MILHDETMIDVSLHGWYHMTVLMMAHMYIFPGLHPSLSADGLVTLDSARGGAKKNPKNQSSSDLFY